MFVVVVVCCLLQLCPIKKKPFKREKLCGQESERGVNSILTTILRFWPTSRKDVSKTDLPFKFCKIGLKNTLFTFGRKNGRLLFVVVVCLLLFVATLSDFGLLFLN